MTKLTVIAGPTAVGKGTVVRRIMEIDPAVQLSVSVTTREPRPGEIDGVHYHFVSVEQFDQMIRDGELLEYAVVHKSHKYGTPRKPVEDAIAKNQQIILEIDLQGARQVKTAMPDANLIFIAAPSWEELGRRLTERGTETNEQIAVRLDTAKAEMAAQGEFDHVVINEDVAKCAHEVLDLMQA